MSISSYWTYQDMVEYADANTGNSCAYHFITPRTGLRSTEEDSALQTLSSISAAVLNSNFRTSIFHQISTTVYQTSTSIETSQPANADDQTIIQAVKDLRAEVRSQYSCAKLFLNDYFSWTVRYCTKETDLQKANRIANVLLAKLDPQPTRLQRIYNCFCSCRKPQATLRNEESIETVTPSVEKKNSSCGISNCIKGAIARLREVFVPRQNTLRVIREISNDSQEII